MQNLPSPNGYGWMTNDGQLEPYLMTQDPAPTSIAELTICGCKKSVCSRQSCKCCTAGLPCTEACPCMGDETCLNPYMNVIDDD